jgi:predicted esterase YcpF (UPF0227 family)
MILYLHGFNSSPASTKSQLMLKKMQQLDLADQFICPALPYQPSRAITLIENEIEKLNTDRLTIVGSSLGGFYATWLAEKYDCLAVLINPAVRPYEGFADYIGPQRNYHTGEEYDFKLEYVNELVELEVEKIAHPENFLLLVETGDEICPYEKAVAKYRGCVQVVIEGGDHSFINFPQYIETILRFDKLMK